MICSFSKMLIKLQNHICWFQICTWNFVILSSFGDTSIWSLPHILLISEVNSCPILMFEYSNQSLGPPLQESELKLPLEGLKVPNNGKNVSKNCQLAIFGHVFAIIRCFRGHLVAKLFHILVEEVLSFDLSGLALKSDKNCLQKWTTSTLVHSVEWYWVPLKQMDDSSSMPPHKSCSC